MENPGINFAQPPGVIYLLKNTNICVSFNNWHWNFFVEKEHEEKAAQVKTALRTVFVVLALSFHSIIEGKNVKL